MATKKFQPVLLIIVGLLGLIHYNAQNDEKEVTIQTLSQTHVNYKDAESYTQFIEQLSREAQEAEKYRRLSNKKIELEKMAKAEEAKQAKLVEEERIAKEIAEEEARVAQEAAVAQEETTVAQEDEVVSEPVYTEPVVTEVVQQEVPVQTRTDGFNFNGRHFDVAWFSGSGQVPADSYVYRWSTDSSHYLVEMMGAAGGVIRELHVGSHVVIDQKKT